MAGPAAVCFCHFRLTGFRLTGFRLTGFRPAASGRRAVWSRCWRAPYGSGARSEIQTDSNRFKRFKQIQTDSKDSNRFKPVPTGSNLHPWGRACCRLPTTAWIPYPPPLVPHTHHRLDPVPTTAWIPYPPPLVPYTHHRLDPIPTTAWIPRQFGRLSVRIPHSRRGSPPPAILPRSCTHCAYTIPLAAGHSA
jgi:hypothetical protein